MIREMDSLSIGKGVLFLLSVVLLVTGCSSELDRAMDECREQFPPFAQQMAELDEEWNDTLEIAASTSRIALAGPVGELQSIRREVNRLNPPECVSFTHESYVEGMDAFIGFFLDFMSDPDTELDDGEVSVATVRMLSLPAEIDFNQEDPEAFFDQQGDCSVRPWPGDNETLCP